jgi:DNA-nicking Smr family endonuclease
MHHDPEETVVVPIEDSLDLHTFQPREVKDLLDDYLEAARAKGFREVAIIHGKGSGMLRRRVHSILARHPLVASFREADPDRGGWGATVAALREKGREGLTSGRRQFHSS